MEYYIALDIGNVLCRVDLMIFMSSLSNCLKSKNLLSIEEVSYKTNLYQKLQDLGLLTMSEILQLELGIKSQVILDNLLNIWNTKVLKFDNDVFDFFSKFCKQNKLNIALLSNIGLDHVVLVDDYINSNLVPKEFNEAIRYYSCNVGVRKPQSLYYQSFLLQYPKFKGCVYLDDRIENLEASLQFGFKAIEFNLDKMTDVNPPLQAIKKIILENT